MTDYSPSRSLVAAIEWATALPRRRARRIAVLMVVLIGALDFVTGPGVSLNGLYLLTLCFAAWTLGERPGYATAASIAIMIIACNGFGDGRTVAETTLPLWTIGWNVFMRLFVNMTVAAVVSGFRHCFDQERLLARRDPLTGLLNKRAFFEDARSRLAHAHRLGHCVVLAYVDLDGFKGVNDRFGHAAGDLVLRGFADGAIGRLRRYDLAGRLGGDEFVFLMTVPAGGSALTVAERIHANLSDCLSHAPVRSPVRPVRSSSRTPPPTMVRH